MFLDDTWLNGLMENKLKDEETLLFANSFYYAYISGSESLQTPPHILEQYCHYLGQL